MKRLKKVLVKVIVDKDDYEEEEKDSEDEDEEEDEYEYGEENLATYSFKCADKYMNVKKRER
eukprot:88948-Hanusia_phi.AAC.1